MRLAWMTLVVIAGCGGKASPSMSPPPGGGVEVEGDGWTCFSTADGHTACQESRRRCAAAIAEVAGAADCTRMASVWCYEGADGGDLGPETTCVTTEDECRTSAGTAPCTETSETPMQAFERLAKERDAIEAMSSGATQPVPTYRCFTYLNKAVNTTQAICGSGGACDSERAEVMKTGLAVNPTDCAAAASVWCFPYGTDTCLPTQRECETRRTSLLGANASPSTACSEKQ